LRLQLPSDLRDLNPLDPAWASIVTDRTDWRPDLVNISRHLTTVAVRF
jgi:hypothetical protein